MSLVPKELRFIYWAAVLLVLIGGLLGWLMSAAEAKCENETLCPEQMEPRRIAGRCYCVGRPTMDTDDHR